MAVGKVGLLRENFLERSDGGFKLLLINVALRLVEQVVEWVGQLFCFGLASRFRFRGGLRLTGKGLISKDCCFICRATREGMRRCHKRSEEHTSELQSHSDLVCRLLLEKKKKKKKKK